MTYRCNNRQPFATTVLVQSGWTSDGRRNLVEIPFRMSTDCKYSTDPMVGSKDKGCVGCSWRAGA